MDTCMTGHQRHDYLSILTGPAEHRTSDTRVIISVYLFRKTERGSRVYLALYGPKGSVISDHPYNDAPMFVKRVFEGFPVTGRRTIACRRLGSLGRIAGVPARGWWPARGRSGARCARWCGHCRPDRAGSVRPG